MTDPEITLKRVSKALADIRQAREFLAQRNLDRVDISLSDAEHTLAFFWDYISNAYNLTTETTEVSPGKRFRK
jgi:hypothetical protein